jgi:hypothetical protein
MTKGTENHYEMSIRMGFGISSQGRDVRLHVEDKTSGVQILEATLDSEQFTAMLSGGSADVLAWFTPKPERVGRIHQHEQWTMSAYDNTKDEAEAAAESWRAQHGWDTAEIRRNNAGQWVIVGRRWVAQTDKES